MVYRHRLNFAPKILQLVPQLTALGTLCLLTACGGGGGGGGSSTPSAQYTLGGVVSKGILQNAIVTAYSIDTSGKRSTQVGQPVRTDTQGQYTLKVPGTTGSLLIEETVDAQTTEICDSSVGCGSTAFGTTFTPPTTLVMDTMVGSVSGTTKTSAQITPFTQLATRLAMNSSGGLSASNITQSLAQVATIFGLTDLNTTVSADVTASNIAGALTASQQYAVMNAAIATLAAQANSTPQDIISNLAQELITQQGITNTTGSATVTTTSAQSPSLANIFSAATAVSNKVTGLSAQVNTNLSTALTTANSQKVGSIASVTFTPAVLPSQIAKNFINNLHTLLQSALSLDSAGNMATLTSAYKPVSTLLQSHSAELSLLMHSSVALGRFLANEAQSATAGTTPATTDFNTFFNIVNTRSPIIFTANSDFVVSTAANTVTLNGSVKAQPGYWNWNWNCPSSNSMCLTPIAGTSPITITLNNLSITYPASSTTAASSYTVALAPNGTISSPNVTLNSGSAGGTFTLNYTTTTPTLINPVKLSPAQLTGNTAPDSATFSLPAATLTESSTVFTGAVSVSAQKITESVADTNNQTPIPTLVPTLLSISGSLNTGVNKDSLQVNASASLNNPSTQKNAFQVSMGNGYKNNNLLTYQYFPASGSNQEYAEISLNSGIQIAPWSWPFSSTSSPDAVFLVNVPAPNSYCPTSQSSTATNNALLMLTEETGTTAPWPYTGGSTQSYYSAALGCNSATSLQSALTALSSQTSSTNSYLYYLSLSTNRTNYDFVSWFANAGTSLGSTTPIPMTATVIYSYGSLSAGSTPAIVALSASVSASITLGGAVHSVQLKVSGDRTGLNTGDALINLTLDSLPTLTIAEPNYNKTLGSSNIQLSDSSGASINLPISAFASASTSGGISVPIMVGTTKEGTLTKGTISSSTNFSNAILATFTDNTTIAL